MNPAYCLPPLRRQTCGSLLRPRPLLSAQTTRFLCKSPNRKYPFATSSPAYSQSSSIPVRPKPAVPRRKNFISQSLEIPKWKATIAESLGKLLGYYRTEPMLIRKSMYLYERCAEQTEKNVDWVVKSAHLPDTYQTWFSLSLIHVWMVIVRLRAIAPSSTSSPPTPSTKFDPEEVIQSFVDHFFRDMEDRLWAMGIKQNSIIQRSLKEFLSMFYGGVMAYDEGLGAIRPTDDVKLLKDGMAIHTDVQGNKGQKQEVHGDIVIGSAVWRNLFDMNSSMDNVATVVEYIWRELYHLDSISDEEILNGKVTFSSLLNEIAGIRASVKIPVSDVMKEA